MIRAYIPGQSLNQTGRGLDFTAQGLKRNVDDQNEELSVSFTKAYEATLKKHHNFVVKGLFSVSPACQLYRYIS